MGNQIIIISFEKFIVSLAVDLCYHIMYVMLSTMYFCKILLHKKVAYNCN